MAINTLAVEIEMARTDLTLTLMSECGPSYMNDDTIDSPIILLPTIITARNLENTADGIVDKLERIIIQSSHNKGNGNIIFFASPVWRFIDNEENVLLDTDEKILEYANSRSAECFMNDCQIVSMKVKSAEFPTILEMNDDDYFACRSYYFVDGPLFEDAISNEQIGTNGIAYDCECEKCNTNA